MSARVVSDAAFIAAVEGARSISFSAYVLSAGSDVARALSAAAEMGARVDVVLDGVPYGRSASAIARLNAAAAAQLTRHGAHVRLTDPLQAAMHLKAAVVDGSAYLDDRNWAEGDRDTIVELDGRDDVAAVAAALEGGFAPSGAVCTDKASALALEAQTIYDAPGDRIDIETESFGGSVVSKAISFRVAHGTHVRLLVSAAELRSNAGSRERRMLERLAASGIEVATTANTEKLCVGGGVAWLGSANATYSPQPTIDWGLRSSDPAIVAPAERAFAKNWAGARPLSSV